MDELKKIAYDELLEELRENLKNVQEEKERLEIDYQKLRAELTLYEKVKRQSEDLQIKFKEISQRYDNFSFNDIDSKLQDARTLVSNLEDIMKVEFKNYKNS